VKYIVLVPAGAADQPYEELGGRTPLEVSRTPNLDVLASQGSVGLVKTIPDKIEPASDIGNLSILGYNPRNTYPGRGPLEAAGLNVAMQPEDIAFRINFVTEADGHLVDYSAGHLSTAEAKVLIGYLNSKLGTEGLKFYCGLGYRHVAVVSGRSGSAGLKASCTPPQRLIGKETREGWPKGPGDEWLRKVMLDAKKLLHDHEINQVRLDLKENPASMIWFWGQGAATKLPSLKERFGLSGACVAAVPVVKGIARLAGLDVLDVDGATGYVETNFEGKARKGLEALKQSDFTLIHVEAADAASLAGNLKAKIQALEEFDRLIVKPVREYCERHPDTRVLILPDHLVSTENRTYVRGAVPFLLYGKEIAASAVPQFSEKVAQTAEFMFEEGSKLFEYFIGSPEAKTVDVDSKRA